MQFLPEKHFPSPRPIPVACYVTVNKNYSMVIFSMSFFLPSLNLALCDSLKQPVFGSEERFIAPASVKLAIFVAKSCDRLSEKPYFNPLYLF